MEEAIQSWMTQNREEVEKTGLKLIDIRKEFAKLNIGGYFIQVIIPPAFHDPCPADLNYDSALTAITLEELEDEVLQTALVVLNEKLERVRIGPDWFTRVLDNILQIFGQYRCWKSAMYKLAQGAIVQREEALRKLDEHSIPENILPWCSVSVDPTSETVEMKMETEGIMGSHNVARALGFCLYSPLVILLRFGHQSEKMFYVESFGYVEVLVKSLHEVPQSEASMQTLMGQLDDERLRNAVSKCCRTRISQYGPQTLVPKLVKEFFDNCSKRENRVDCTGLVAESNNILIRLLIYLGNHLKNMSNFCVFCSRRLPSHSRWWCCDEELCLYTFEETDTGASILQELRNSEWIEVELSLARDATTSNRDVFEPYPSFLLKKQEIRKRSGFFSDYPPGESLEFRMAIMSMEPENSRELGIKNYLDNKKLDLLRLIIDSFPPVAEMQECTSDVVLMQKLGASWLRQQCYSDNFEVDKLSEEDYVENVTLAYNVLRYVLFTNRLSMNLVQQDLRFDVPGSLYQFAVFYDSEREQSFERRRKTEGSIVAFHGSASCNWYSIIRNGLRCLSRTDYMSSGTAHGQGIYFYTELDVARSHSSPISGWKNGNLKGYGVVAICEILSGQWYFVNESESCLVVPSENENDVAIRYLIVCKNEYNEKGFLTTASRMLSTETRFLGRYQSLRNYYSQGNEGLFQKHQHLDGHNMKLMKTQ